jgi:hypothetical protein
MRASKGCCRLAVLTAALWCAASAAGRAYVPPAGHVFAGLTGGTSIVPFERMVGKHPPVFELYMTWDTRTAWLSGSNSSFRSRLGLHISTASGYAQAGVISPEAIALGHSDRFLVALARNLARSGRIVYVRVMGEMNGYWNAYAAYNADGSFRGEQNSPHFYIEAWRRTVLILRGGPVRRLNHRLRALGLPGLRVKLPRASQGRAPQGHAPVLPRPKLAFLWVPQDAGSPETSANAPGAFWPGSAYVDWVGTDFYASYPNFSLLDAFYSEFGGKPFVLSEWAVYGFDDPGFVHELFAWARSHPRVRMLNYYQGFTASSRANLAHYPASQRALRQELRSARYLRYPPEYAHPHKRRRHHPPPAQPPRPPQPGIPPSPPAPNPQLCVPLLPVCVPGL